MHHLSGEAVQYQPGPPLTILGDHDELRAAVSNLLDNAVKYSASGVHVGVTVQTEEDRYAVLRVQDTGTGIEEPDLKRIFKRFYRAGAAVSSRVKGTGLGLFIVRNVVRRHGGKVWAESAGPGHGSTFVMRFPLARSRGAEW